MRNPLMRLSGRVRRWLIRGLLSVVVLATLSGLGLLGWKLFYPTTQAGHQETCMANLHQLSMAIFAYKQDWGKWPYGFRAFYPAYQRDPSVLLCPDDRTGPERRKELQAIFGAYSSYLTYGGDLLYIISRSGRELYSESDAEGWAYWKTCEQYRGQMPLFVCYHHLLAYRVGSEEALQKALAKEKVHSVFLKVNQDSHVSHVKVPEECPYADVTTPWGAAGIPADQWKQTYRSWLAQGRE